MRHVAAVVRTDTRMVTVRPSRRLAHPLSSAQRSLSPGLPQYIKLYITLTKKVNRYRFMYTRWRTRNSNPR